MGLVTSERIPVRLVLSDNFAGRMAAAARAGTWIGLRRHLTDLDDVPRGRDDAPYLWEGDQA